MTIMLTIMQDYCSPNTLQCIRKDRGFVLKYSGGFM